MLLLAIKHREAKCIMQEYNAIIFMIKTLIP